MTKQALTAKNYSPLYFLNALGAGGLVVSFYMYLMWMTPHQGSPIPSFSSLAQALSTGDYLTILIIAVGGAGAAFFAVYHVLLLAWNLKLYGQWKKTEKFTKLKESNGETQLMAVPLTLAMTVNVAFIVGAVFVPTLWENRELLFPLALIAFALIGISALRTYLDFFTRVLTEGGFDCAKNNSLGQMVSVFAFSMIGVGFSSAAAMSHERAVVALGFIGATFFITIALLLGVIKLVLGIRAMMEHRADAETTPTLWIIIPILTVLGIAIYRLKMSLIHNFDVKIAPAEISAFLVVLFSVQVFFGLIGWSVMKRVKYLERWVHGTERSAGAYALVCPGVALFVLGNFLINVGGARIQLVEAMTIPYALLYIPLIYLQIITIRLFFRLNSKLMIE